MKIQQNIDLKLFNSFQTQAVAKLFCRPKSEDELIEAIQRYPHEKKLILGEGCNLFFTHDFDGLVIKPEIMGIETLQEDAQNIEIEVGAGENWDHLVEICTRKGYSGLERLSYIPSSVGATPVQNIGAYGAEAKDRIVAVKTVDMTTGECKTFPAADCGFAYRNSLFKQTQRYAVSSVVFKLNKTFRYENKYAEVAQELQSIASPTPQQVREAVIKIRQRKLPDFRQTPNAGSFFKNPILTKVEKEALEKVLPQATFYELDSSHFKTSAAYLIESAGLKGSRQGMVGICEKHALIVVNYGTHDGAAILKFAQHVQREVKRVFNIVLEPEVRIY